MKKIKYKGALPPTASDTPNMTYNELKKLRMQQ
jgi:hypothetical protein